ncbi:hypothetical protein ACM44_02160 [Chryseobacterium koreense CCUG 49689]|uniref:Uncharacterized protein n=1 Tax=Chryseobacterium koreense CCUG 49689 TaxID=1304281 RepID=A0A0J7J2J6_9FLAO|nr:hypothetical protein ACM44_02160 [Chryseobacterium koreense CCUG 49689]
MNPNMIMAKKARIHLNEFFIFLYFKIIFTYFFYSFDLNSMSKLKVLPLRMNDKTHSGIMK